MGYPKTKKILKHCISVVIESHIISLKNHGHVSMLFVDEVLADTLQYNIFGKKFFLLSFITMSREEIFFILLDASNSN